MIDVRVDGDGLRLALAEAGKLARWWGSRKPASLLAWLRVGLFTVDVDVEVGEDMVLQAKVPRLPQRSETDGPGIAVVSLRGLQLATEGDGDVRLWGETEARGPGLQRATRLGVAVDLARSRIPCYRVDSRPTLIDDHGPDWDPSSTAGFDDSQCRRLAEVAGFAHDMTPWGRMSLACVRVLPVHVDLRLEQGLDVARPAGTVDSQLCRATAVNGHHLGQVGLRGMYCCWGAPVEGGRRDGWLVPAGLLEWARRVTDADAVGADPLGLSWSADRQVLRATVRGMTLCCRLNRFGHGGGQEDRTSGLLFPDVDEVIPKLGLLPVQEARPPFVVEVGPTRAAIRRLRKLLGGASFGKMSVHFDRPGLMCLRVRARTDVSNGPSWQPVLEEDPVDRLVGEPHPGTTVSSWDSWSTVREEYVRIEGGVLDVANPRGLHPAYLERALDLVGRSLSKEHAVVRWLDSRGPVRVEVYAPQEGPTAWSPALQAHTLAVIMPMVTDPDEVALRAPAPPSTGEQAGAANADPASVEG